MCALQSQPHRNVHSHAADIATAVDLAWHRACRSGPLEVPVSVVAALSFLTPSGNERAGVAEWLAALDVDRFRTVMASQWAHFVRARPDLVTPAWPLIRPWHGEQQIDDAAAKAAAEVWRAALRAGQLDLTGTLRRRETDLFGVLLATLRSRTVKTAHGEFCTPADVASTMAHLLGASDGVSFHEPAAGTGGMLRALAESMRATGRDPSTIRWSAVDTDELAIACLAVNAVLWELGHEVVLGVGDSLTDEWLPRAEAQRAEAIDVARWTHAFKALERLVPPTARTPTHEVDGTR